MIQKLGVNNTEMKLYTEAIDMSHFMILKAMTIDVNKMMIDKINELVEIVNSKDNKISKLEDDIKEINEEFTKFVMDSKKVGSKQ